MKRRILYLFFMVLAVSPFVAAQIITGTIQGSVLDPTGAVLPGVDMTVRNLDTNQARTSLTNETGNFLIPLLPVGTYEVTAELPGFQTQVKTGMQLQVEQRMNLTFTLEVGNITRHSDRHGIGTARTVGHCNRRHRDRQPEARRASVEWPAVQSDRPLDTDSNHQ